MTVANEINRRPTRVGDATQLGTAFLRNTVRTPGVTCLRCRAPVHHGYRLCWQCGRHPSSGADLVLPLTYAIAGTESGAFVSAYKRHPSLAVRHRYGAVAASLMGITLALHQQCIDAAVGHGATVRTVVPSTTGRPGVHPLEAALCAAGVPTVQALRPAGDLRCARTVDADKFLVTDRPAVAGQHVLLLDDVWTTGSTAQSAVTSLKRGGALAVTVLTFGRWLNPAYPSVERFVARHLTDCYDPTVCPVAGKRCE